MFFTKCFPTHSSSARTEEQQRDAAAIPMRSFVSQFSIAASNERVESYQYIKSGNVEKLLEALRNGWFKPQTAWALALQHPSSPALYLFAIEKLEMGALQETILAMFRTKNIADELPGVMEQSYAALAARSYGELSAHDLNVLDVMVKKDSPIWLAGSSNHKQWSALFAIVLAQSEALRTLHKPEPKRSLLARCCSMGRRN